MKNMLLVMNPYAGMRRGSRQLADIISLFNRADYAVSAYMTAQTGDAARVIAQRAAEVDLVVVAGGDGTLNEAVNGILQSGAEAPLGYIPCGSTNDFANSLKIPTGNVLLAAQAILDGQVQRYDVGKFDDRYFTYVASFGAFTKTAYSTPQNVKNALGHAAYVLGSIQELSQLKPAHVRFEFEDRVIEDDFIFGAISNSTSVGGILTLDPKQVDMRDGKFELLLVRAPKDLIELSDCILAVQKQVYNCAMMTFVSAKKFSVFADPGMAWTLDGELHEGESHIDVENHQHAIRLITKG